MFSKFVNKICAPSLSMSIITKLMALYAVSTIAILAAISLYLYPLFVKVMHELHAHHAVVLSHQCLQQILMALIMGLFAALLLGKLVAVMGLRRLREFESAMEKTSADSLETRIAVDDWPKELRILGAKFNLMLERLETSFSRLSQFSADIAHEFRGPLHNLLARTELELTKNKLPSCYIETLASHMHEYHQLSKLIDDLLFLARSEHKQIPMQRLELSAHEMVENIFEYFSPLAEEKNIRLTCEGRVKVLFDPDLFKRVFYNLISNAIHYVSQKGSIKVTLKNIAPSVVEIAIHDNGVGISKEHLSKIFDRFYRVDSSRSSASGGVGLGLPIVKSIVELHHGKIWLESQLNIGTSVYIHLTQ